MNSPLRLLIGSIGDDIHSVGMALLTLALQEEGLLVRNLGIGNSLDDFFALAAAFDGILISCNNGHADLYLDTFPHRLAAYRRRQGRPNLWYLGGNLSVQEGEEAVARKYRHYGFDFVAPKPIGWRQVLAQLRRDAYRRGISPRGGAKPEDEEVLSPPDLALLDLRAVDDEPLSQEVFAATRREVLGSWPTGAQVWDADVKAHHRRPEQNLHRVTVARMAEPGLGGLGPLLQPRTGVAHVADEIALLLGLEASGLNVSSIQLDSASRKNRYAEAEEGLRRSKRGGISFLNGFPVPNHGVEGVRSILGAINTPFQIRAGSPDHRLVYEIALAGGASSVEGGFLCYLFPYDKRTSPVENLHNWKYVDTLAGLYQSRYGITINREYFGPLTTTLIEPSIPVAINVVQAILSAKAGVRCISPGLAEQGNRIQDIAAIRVLGRTVRYYLSRHGLPGCTVSPVYHQFMGAFPRESKRAAQLIVASSTTAALSGAARVLIKTPVESSQIPTIRDNAEAMRLTREGVARASDTAVDHGAVEREEALLEAEVTGIMSVIEALGEGSVARGAIRAFEAGILDVPFSPSVYNCGQRLTIRDRNGAVRFVNPEGMPFDQATIDLHRRLVEERMTLERVTRPSELIERDLTRIWQGEFVRWPLDGHYVD